MTNQTYYILGIFWGHNADYGNSIMSPEFPVPGIPRTFTVEAEKEARRDGAPPIELVDEDDLVTLFKNLEFGLRPRKTFDVNDKFFDEFR